MASTSALQKSLLNMFSPLLSSMAKSYKGVVGTQEMRNAVNQVCGQHVLKQRVVG